MDQTTAARYYQEYHELKKKLDDYMKTLADTGCLIDAIKLHRHLFNSNLKDAREHIQALSKR